MTMNQKLGLGAVIGLLLLGFGLSQQGYGHGDPSLNPDDYSSCTDLAKYPGTNPTTAHCVDENGSVVSFSGWQSRH